MNPADTAPLNSPPFGWMLLLTALAWTVLGARKGGEDKKIGWKWWTLAGAALVCFRWPLLWVPHQLNPDESQLIAGAITLKHDPVFWRSVDGGTAGPVDFYPLLPAAWASGTVSFAIARMILLAAIFGSLVCAGEAIAVFSCATIAQLAVLPTLTFFALTTDPDFIHASTEVIPVLLLAVTGWLIAQQIKAPSPACRWWIAMFLGAVPWAKLQATPLAFALFVLTTWCELRRRNPHALLPLVVGVLVPTVVAFGVATVTGQIEHLVTPYILQNLSYVGTPQFSWGATLVAQWQLAWVDGYLGFWLGCSLVLLVIGLAQLPSANESSRRETLVALALLAVGLISALGPRRPSLHHLQLLLLPLVWFSGATLALMWKRAQPPLIAGAFLAVSVAPQLSWRARDLDAFAPINQSAPTAAHRQLPSLVQKFSTPDESLAIWGWRSSLYVESGRRQATRQAHTEAQIYSGPLQSYFLRRYFEDFRTANPPVFADAVGPGNFAFDDRARAHEAFPPLRDWVRSHYTMIVDLDGTRLFVRNDRLVAAGAVDPDSHAR